MTSTEEKNVPVRVALRIRPPVLPENATAHQDTPVRRLSLSIVPGSNSVVIGKDREQLHESSSSQNLLSSSPQSGSGGLLGNLGKRGFTFDTVYAPETSQKELYDSSCAGLVNQFLEGFNVTIFAYGQIRQTMEGIRNRQQQDQKVDFSLKCTFLEIYQEQLRDLLMPDIDSKDIAIREDRSGAITISGIHEQTVRSEEDLFKCLDAGGIERTTGDTRMHLHSSRSHAIFTIILEARMDVAKTDDGGASQGTALMRCSKLHLVDLAGSERLKRTGAEGVRFRESVKINSGLLALGNVISVLGGDNYERGMGKDNSVHVPYRDSKLTRLLQDSLGGNSKTLMIACVSPCEEDCDETLNTLKYADRARKIQNKPVVNTIDTPSAKLASMQEKIDFLEKQLRRNDSNNTLVEHPKSESSHRPSTVDSELLLKLADTADMDNEQWMGFFVEELKSRTIRGTNAMRALKEATEEIERLNTRTADLEERLINSRLQAQQLGSKAEKMENEKSIIKLDYDQLEGDLELTLRTLSELLQTQNLKPDQQESLKSIFTKYKPQEQKTLEILDSKVSFGLKHIPEPVEPAQPPTASFIARFQRRRGKQSQETSPQPVNPSADSHHHALKQLEDELLLSESEKKQLKEDLQNASTKLLEEESLMEEKKAQLARLERINTELELEVSGLKRHAAEQSNKVSTDSFCQTEFDDTIVHGAEGVKDVDNEHFP
ncbi:hypothetical protein HDU76_003178, partial [Blyttiomyces sp. JEL0837]